MMNELLTAYLRETMKDPELEILSYEPMIRYDEQHYIVNYDNKCSWSGSTDVEVSNSDLLEFMWNKVSA